MPPTQAAEIQPVVGWLVCTEGPDKGRDFRLRTGRNYLGRSPMMEVCIPADMAISRERHATVLYDAKRFAFWAAPGQGTGQLFLNGEAVEAPKPMKAEDVLELGQTKLVLIPFCGENRSWDK